MIRLLNILALVAVISSATWAYSVKYETILVSEKLRKSENELQRERDAIAILKAEWNLLNRPERLQQIAKPEPGMQALSARQVVHAGDVPKVVPGAGDKIEDLLTGSIPTPDIARKNVKTRVTTPAAKATASQPRPKTKAGSITTTAARPAAAAPVRLVPPAALGSTTQPARRAESGGNPLTGFLKNLLR